MNDAGRTILIALLVVIALPLFWAVVMMGAGGGMMGGVGPSMMGGWDADDRWEPWRAIIGLLSTVLVIGGIGAIAVWALGRTTTPAPPPSGPPSARGVLDARYARGEITREQYQQIRDDLAS